MMSASFQLLTEPWIPVTYEGDMQARDVSLRVALRDAHRIKELADPSPLVTVALHRLLLAIVHRVFGPATDAEWGALWEAGCFQPEALDEYLETRAGRFDLFHPERPFYQTPGLPDTTATTVAKLGHEFAAGNNPLLFDHSQDAAPTPVSPAEAARRLVAHQAFAVGGLVSRLPGEAASANSSHLVKAAVVLIRGRSLFETLMLNLVQLDGDEGEPFPFEAEGDETAWDREEPTRFTERSPVGYLDLLTWQSRRILLLPEGPPLRVRRAVIMGGFQFPAHVLLNQMETMAAYRTRERGAGGNDPWFPVGFSPGRALWRDSFALLAQQGEARQRPQVVRTLSRRQREGWLNAEAKFDLAAFGLATDRAKVFLWRREELPLPAAYLENEDLVRILGTGVEAAEHAARRLRSGVLRLAELALAPEGKADRPRVNALVASLGTDDAYWPAIDIPFREFMRRLPETYDTRSGLPARQDWARAISRAARDAFEQAAGALETSGRGWRAAAAARPLFYGTLTNGLSDFAEWDHDLEEASA